MDASPDRQVYAEQAAHAARLLVEHLPPDDPLRACLVDAVEPADSAWAMLIDEHADGRTTVRHPPTGPTLRYGPLGRAYQVPFDEPPRVVVAQLGDAEDDAALRLNVASVYVEGRSVASVIDSES